MFEGAGALLSLIAPGKSRLNPSSALFVHLSPCQVHTTSGVIVAEAYILITTKTATCNGRNLSLEGQVIYLDVVLHVAGPSLLAVCCIPGACQACWHTPGWNNPEILKSAAVNSVACRVEKERGHRKICSSGSACLFISIFPSPPSRHFALMP